MHDGRRECANGIVWSVKLHSRLSVILLALPHLWFPVRVSL